MDLTVGLLFAEFLCKTILSLLLHLGIKLGIGPGQLLLDLPLQRLHGIRVPRLDVAAPGGSGAGQQLHVQDHCLRCEYSCNGV